MKEINQMSVLDIVIVGFEGPQDFRIVSSAILLLLFLMTLAGNSLIMVIISISHRLHSPMYFFLCHLSITDIIVPSNIVPNLLYVTLTERGTIPFSNCLAQFFFFDSLLYVDHYITRQLINCWLVAFTLALLVVCHMLTFQFCGSNIINHLFCDLHPFLKLSCSDTFVVDIEVLVTGILVIVLACVLIVVTYIWIFHSILGNSTTTGRQKAISTCSSHLTVVCTYYATLVTNYMMPLTGRTTNLAKYISLLYTVITPLMNPIIYTLRNKEIKSALNSYIH
ncbi:hypothetical protein XELAEV_18019363mg [Xenopus laevis]|uniref:G-protein coupled receptors family 1 profile domain-containing protein n=1 Tax=Xenopus laevis TaxID=8355 RepID=A0A974DGP2_XENLA|nr:hypothetical protein XELAEV_18019363mg [Xenopus laevis]